MEKLFYNLCQKFSDIITARGKIVVACFLLLFIGTVIFSVYFKFMISTEILLWTFSTIAQVLSGIVALMGMVCVFKLQIISQRIDQTIAVIGEDYKYFSHHWPIGDAKAIYKEIKSMFEKHTNKQDPHNQNLKWAIDRLEYLFSVEKKVRNLGLEFIVFTLITIVLDIIFLFFSSCFQNYGLIPTFLILYFAFYSLFLTIKFVAEGLFD